MKTTNAAAVLVLSAASAVVEASAPVYLSPVQDILLPASGSATNPLTSLGANSPWFAGMFLFSFLGFRRF